MSYIADGVKHTGPLLYGCHNRAPFAESYTVKACVLPTGRYQLKQQPHVNSRECKHDMRETDPACSGCKWRNED